MYTYNGGVEFEATYEETSTTALSANQSVVPLLTINGWILMQRKITGGSVTFNKYWEDYRDGFGSTADNDNYWLGLDKVYCLVQLGSVRLRVEVMTLSPKITRFLTLYHANVPTLTPFSKKDKILTKNLYECKDCNARQFITKFLYKGWTKNNINWLTVKVGTVDRRPGSGRHGAHSE